MLWRHFRERGWSLAVPGSDPSENPSPFPLPVIRLSRAPAIASIPTNPLQNGTLCISCYTAGKIRHSYNWKLGRFALHETFRCRIAGRRVCLDCMGCCERLRDRPALDMDLAVAAYAARRHTHSQSGDGRGARVESCAERQAQSCYHSCTAYACGRIDSSVQSELTET